MFLYGLNQRLVAGQRLHGAREQDATHLDLELFASTRGVKTCRCQFYGAAQRGLYLVWVFFRDHAAIDLEHHLAGDHVGVGAANNLAHVKVRVGNALHAGVDYKVVGVERVQGLEDVGGAL